LKLQASLIKGNEVECFNTYKKMLEYGSSRPIAINGLISFASKNNDTELFSNMLNSASNYKVSLEAFLTEAFNFCLKSQDWIILKEYVNKESRHKLKKIKSFLNILDYQLATQYYKKGEIKEAKEALGDIFLSKNFFPPSVELYLKINTDKTERKLKKILKAYWSHFPHYSIINCVLNNFKSHDILKKVKLLIELLEGKNDLYLKYMLLGEIKVKAKIWGDAKNDLYKSIQLYPNRKAYYLLVHIEEQTTCNKEKIKNWLSLAQNCKEEVWRCKSCMHIHKKWSISCDNCNSFLTLINDELQNFSKKQPDLLLSGNYLKVV
ncbi:MAG: hypothetical protein VX089_01270, partial [Pseudomonadota bacterium]|nr:hypothetical protein [Pseudomonadota bacterium]